MMSLVTQLQGKKHAQKLKLYLQAKRAEKINTESAAPQVSNQVEICKTLLLNIKQQDFHQFPSVKHLSVS